MEKANQTQGGAGFGCLGAILGFVLSVIHSIITWNSINTATGSPLIVVFSLILYLSYMSFFFVRLRKSRPTAAIGLVIGSALILLLNATCATLEYTNPLR